MTKIDKDTYIEFLKKLEESNIPENLKFMLRNSWYGDAMPYTTLLEIKWNIMKIQLKKRIVMHKTPEVESTPFYAKWQIEDLGTICDGIPIKGAFKEAPKYAYKFEKFDMENDNIQKEKKIEEGTLEGCQEISDMINDKIIEIMKIEGKL